MAIGYSRSRKYPFILKRELAEGFDPAKRTTFFVRPMTAAMHSDFQEFFAKVRKVDPESTEGLGGWCIKIVRDCLVGWENFTTPEGAAIPFPASVDEAIDMIGLDGVTEIGLNIINGSAISGDDRKN